MIVGLALPMGLAGAAAAAERAKPAASAVSNINRLQFRYVTRGGYSINQTMFARWPRGYFLLADMEHNSEYDASPEHQRLELISGGPFAEPPLGWVLRLQKLSHLNAVLSAGLQFNITELQALRETAKRHKVSTFVQLFPFKSDHSYDVFHYYQIPLVGQTYVRGTNSWTRLRDDRRYARAFADFIYPVSKSFDAYVRYSWQNRQDVQYGMKGSTWALGVRYNFSF